MSIASTLVASLIVTSGAHDAQIFDETCSILDELVESGICADVDVPAIEERVGLKNMGNYVYYDDMVLLRKGLTPNTRDRVLAHEFAHHILHVTGIAPAGVTIAQQCLSEEYAHELSKIYGKRHNHILAEGEVNWRSRYPECNEEE